MKGAAAVVFGLAALTLTGCSGETLTVSEYATRTESLVATMVDDFAALDGRWESQPPTLVGALDYWEDRLAIRAAFLSGVESLDPPVDIAPMHDRAVDIFARITRADQAIADRVQTWTKLHGHWDWVDTPEGRASDAILEEVYAFCRASQADFDATADRSALQDVPWIPSEMTEVVSVAYGCPPGE
ncbi:MAG: hypothetical protein HKN74_07420 [Acidimicrobiia bacterium]|nr:hypothetical protein [Acidimicrobiia bacterium]MBT8217181.1 hypothetical protein [Acidimicrobiia bacterium]NNF10096.1 hypothetical protein [Acidimicrobiia bacterium]NNL68610.1 hypothetical protein [Acidimicrobiia bacterium]